jgi:hypothetical protein
LISVCRACADEALGASQADQAFRASDTSSAVTMRAVIRPVVPPHIAGSRLIRDEVLGADQINQASLATTTGDLNQQLDDGRRNGAR